MSGFRFQLHRLNVVHEQQSDWTDDLKIAENDEEIKEIFETCSNSEFDKISEGKKKIYKWAVRAVRVFEGVEIRERGLDSTDVVILTLARSTVEQTVDSVTDSGIMKATSRASPPPAKSIRIIFLMSRHLAIVEYDSTIFRSDKWKSSFSDITGDAARSSGYRSSLNLSTITSTTEMRDAISLFRYVTRLQVHLRIPNPDLIEETQSLYNRMRQSQIRELEQDLKNPDGMSMEQGHMASEALATAEMGYKEGEVTVQGRDEEGRTDTITTGEEVVDETMPMDLPDHTDESGFDGITSFLQRVASRLSRSWTPFTESTEADNQDDRQA